MSKIGNMLLLTINRTDTPDGVEDILGTRNKTIEYSDIERVMTRKTTIPVDDEDYERVKHSGVKGLRYRKQFYLNIIELELTFRDHTLAPLNCWLVRTKENTSFLAEVKYRLSA